MAAHPPGRVRRSSAMVRDHSMPRVRHAAPNPEPHDRGGRTCEAFGRPPEGLVPVAPAVRDAPRLGSVPSEPVPETLLRSVHPLRRPRAAARGLGNGVGRAPLSDLHEDHLWDRSEEVSPLLLECSQGDWT